MSHPLEELRDAALREIAAAPNEQSLEEARVRYLGKSGSISVWSEQMRSLSKDEKPVVGKLLNEVRNAVTAAPAFRKTPSIALQTRLCNGPKEPDSMFSIP